MDRDWTSETIVPALSQCLKTNFWWSKRFFSGKAVIRIGSMKNDQISMTVSKQDRLRIMNIEGSGRPLDNCSLQPTRKNEDLVQSALTEAHGDHVGGKTGTWEARIGKRRLGKPLEKERAPKFSVAWKPGNHGESAKAKGGTRTLKLAVYQGHPWVVSGFGEKRVIPFSARHVAGE